MRNQEAARYARWSAIAAGVIVLIVAGIYADRAIRAARERRREPAAVPASVQRESAQFSYSKVEQDHTIFTIRASRATQFKSQEHVVLEDVWITIFGRSGDRNDNIHTRECGYDPKSGAVRCEGDVEIDIEPAKNVAANSSSPAEAQSLHVKTKDLSFNRETGEAATTQPVDFSFSQGQGHAVGFTYSTSESVVRLEHDVVFELSASGRTGGLPVNASGSSLEIRRNDHSVVLNGPAVVTQRDRKLTADTITVSLDPDFHAQMATATGHPRLAAREGDAIFDGSADRFACLLNPAGWIEQVMAGGNVRGTRRSRRGQDNFAAEHVEFAMRPRENLIQAMTATGSVHVDNQNSASSRELKTAGLRVVFSAGSAKGHAERQRIESAATLAPASLESKSAGDTTKLHAGKLNAQFGANGQLDKILGRTGVQVSRQLGSSALQTASATEFVASFAKGQWDTLDETGEVRFQQAGRQASAEHARMLHSTNTIMLEGSPIISDAQSRTTAANFQIDQQTGEIRGMGGVVSTYVATAAGDRAVNFGGGAAHVSADSLTGSATSGYLAYSGHARLWQDQSALDADKIEVWRDRGKMQASGNVVAVFPQTSGGLAVKLPNDGGLKQESAANDQPNGPTLWHLHAPLLTYWNAAGKAHLEGGVLAKSDQGSLRSQTLDIFLSPAGGPGVAINGQDTVAKGASGGRELVRALARGGVVVSQGDRRATADQAEYTAADEKFVLSGGNPTITDASRDTTTGRSLTFFVANDTILIDSQEGSRTLTKHRVEK